MPLNRAIINDNPENVHSCFYPGFPSSWGQDPTIRFLFEFYFKIGLAPVGKAVYNTIIF
jgi:hypothetical protein